METAIFNPVQQHLLKMFAFDGSEERLSEVKNVLSDYFEKSRCLLRRPLEFWKAESGKA